MINLTHDLRSYQVRARDLPSTKSPPQKLPAASLSHEHPTKKYSATNASLFFIGTATIIWL